MNLNETLSHRFTETSKDHTVFAVMLYGSQNYGLDRPGSDFDTKTMVLPTLRDVALNSKPVSTTVEQDVLGLNDLKDVRLMLDCYRKQNVNFVETLFTEHVAVNQTFLSEWRLLTANREAVARYNDFAALNCMVGMMNEKRHALCHPYPSKVDLVEKYGYDSKQLVHACRLAEMVDRYLAGDPYAELLKTRNQTYLFKVRDYYYSCEEAVALMNNVCSQYEVKKQEYMASRGHKATVNSAVHDMFNEVTVQLLRKQFADEV